METASEGAKNTQRHADDMAALAGKYMAFRLGAEEYGIEILKVRELIGLLEITRVPGAPEAVRGVINLRGKVIPVVDLREKLHMERASNVDRPVIIVVQLQHSSGPLTTGILVDQVLDVRDIKADQIEPPPSFGENDDATRYILGVGKSEKRVVLLIDIDLVLSAAEVASRLSA
jgi:purine-binding chemotaxis protein CheW